MARLSVRFAGSPPFEVRVIDLAPRPGGPPIDRRLLRQGKRDEDPEVSLDLPAGRYRLRLSAANAVELRWVDLPPRGQRIFSDPPDEGPTTWRGSLSVRSRRGEQGFIAPNAVGVLTQRGGVVEDAFLDRLGFARLEPDPERRPAGLRGFIAVSKTPLKMRDSAELALLRAHPAVAAAGPLHRDGNDFALFRAHLHVQFRPGVSPAESGAMLARLRPRQVKALSTAPRLFRVDFAPSMGLAINVFVAQLVADHRVAFAEPGFGDRPVLHAPPSDRLWPMLWDRELLGVAGALEVVGANANVSVAVVDDSFLGVVEHPELNVSSAPPDDGNRHGMACMGLIAAVADGEGLIGVAPDSQLAPIIYSSTGEMDVSLADATAAAADVISGSVGVRDYTPSVVEAQLFSGTRTRGGRGAAQFFSAGDDGATSLLAVSFGSSDFAFATSGVTPAGLKLANGNAGPEVSWCTPASDTDTFPTNWATASPDTGILPAEDRWRLEVLQLDATDPNRCQVSGPIPIAQRTWVIPANPIAASMPAKIVAADAAATWGSTGWIELDAPVPIGVGDEFILGARRLGTVTTTTFSGQTLAIDWLVPLADVGDTVWIGFETSGPITAYAVTNVAATGADLVDPLDAPVFAAHAVFALAQHARSFGATSAANALAAGVGALVLRANPELTFRELEEVLKASANPVVPGIVEADLALPAGWTQAQKDAAVAQANAEAFGAGRLDAFKAVNTALEYAVERADLHIRDSLGDQGDAPTAPMSVSPDIWVQSTAAAPGIDYGAPGPHVDPVAGATNYVCVRVRNRGTRASPQARLILRVARGSLRPFDWPAAWPDGDTTDVLHIGDPQDLASFAAGETRVVCVPWAGVDMLPDAAEPFLLAEITPQDGALADPQVHRNTNLATRPISFTPAVGAPPPIVWRDAANAALGFSTPPSLLVVHVHVSHAVPITYERFAAHGRVRLTDLPEKISPIGQVWDVASETYQLTFDVPETWAEFVLEAEVEDADGRRAPSDQRFHRMAVRLPIEVTLLLDYSGSMSQMAGAESKWSAARRSALLFEHLFNQLSNGDTLKAHSFFHTAGTSQTQGTVVADLPVADPPGGNMTPLGDPIVAAAAGFSPAGPRERVIVLLTDGKENRGATLDEIRADLPANPVSVTQDAEAGVRIHACAFGAAGTVDVDALEGLVHGGDDPALRHFDGRLQTTETLSNPDDAGALTEMFLSVLSDVTGVELIGPLTAADNTFVIEDGVDMFVLVAPAGPATLTLSGPSAPPATTAPGVPGYVQFKVTGNTAGAWTLNGTPATDCFVLVDLQLTSTFTVEPTVDGGFDCAVRLLFAGQPITDARCELRARGPGESIGEAILNAGVRVNARYKGEISKRGRLLQGALERRHQKLRIANNLHLLQPTGAGRFAMTLDGPLRTGTWSFELKVNGTTPSGAPFERLVRASRVIAARPDATTSVVRWATLPSGQQQVVITPKDARGDRLGPGLDLSTLGKGVARALVDRGDGTYAAVFDARQALKLSKHLGARTIPAPAPRMHRVRVVIERVHVRDSHDGREAGEWVFVAQAQLGRARKSTRLPREGVLSMRPSSTLEARAVLVDGGLLEGERLTVRVAGFELDGRARWTKTLRPSGPGVEAVGRAGLRLDGDPRRWAGVHRVGNDSWRVELRVEIDGSGGGVKR